MNLWCRVSFLFDIRSSFLPLSSTLWCWPPHLWSYWASWWGSSQTMHIHPHLRILFSIYARRSLFTLGFTLLIMLLFIIPFKASFLGFYASFYAPSCTLPPPFTFPSFSNLPFQDGCCFTISNRCLLRWSKCLHDWRNWILGKSSYWKAAAIMPRCWNNLHVE